MQFNIQQSSECAEIWLWTKIDHIFGSIPQATYKAAVERVFFDNSLGLYAAVIACKSTTHKNVLKIPQPIIMKNGSKIMSLIDGTKKMSKSDPNEGSRINLLDAPEVITKKIKRAKSDSYIGIEFNNPERAESKNLLMIYSILSGKEISQCENEFSETGWGEFKKLITEQLIESLEPIQEKYKVLINDPYQLNNILKEGKEKAEDLANQTLKRVKSKLGFFEMEK